MKNVFLISIMLLGALGCIAQEDEPKKGGFKLNHLFTGGSITVSFGNNSTVLGGMPMLGYSITPWLDAGVAANFVYQGVRHVTYYNPSSGAYYHSDDKLRQFTYGPGAFVKIYPVKFLFVQAQAEYNFIRQKLIFDSGAPSEKDKTEVPSLLIGAGYCSDRVSFGDMFYYLSIMIDVNKHRRSPYVETTGSGRVNMLPIIRAGLQVPIFQGKRYSSR